MKESRRRFSAASAHSFGLCQCRRRESQGTKIIKMVNTTMMVNRESEDRIEKNIESTSNMRVSKYAVRPDSYPWNSHGSKTTAHGFSVPPLCSLFTYSS